MEWIAQLLPTAGTVVAVVAALVAAHFVLERTKRVGRGGSFRNQLVMLTLSAIGVVAIILALPIGDARRGQLLSLIGIVVSASVALSATTFLGNAMAGLMLRSIGGFRIGDFVRCGEHFGRVSERGLLHTEIQTEDRDLTTIPNLFLVTHPVTTVRSSGTIVSTTVSLGYDVPRARIEKCLLAATEAAGLADGFVYVVELGDFSVSYRVAGLLTEVTSLVSVRSRLRAAVMDALHHDGIEIVSPNFMNQRVLDPDREFIPKAVRPTAEAEPAVSPESVVFDKAEEAATLEELRLRLEKLTGESVELKKQLKETADEAERTAVETRLERLATRVGALERVIAAREKPDQE